MNQVAKFFRLKIPIWLFIVVLVCPLAKADLTLDDIAHMGPLFPLTPDFFTGPGLPAAPMEPGAPDLVVDISTSTILAGSEYWVTYDFGRAAPPTVPSIPADVVTVDLEWVGMPGMLPSVINYYATGPGAITAYAGAIFSPITVADVDSTGGGFDVGVMIADSSFLMSGEGYLIQIGDGHGSGGPPLMPPPGYTLMDSIVITIPEPTTGAMIIAGLCFAMTRRRRKCE